VVAPLEENFLTETKSLEQALAEAFCQADAVEAPLDGRLSFYLGESRKLLPDLEATYDQLVARIQANGADVFVPAVGDKLPDFVMTDSEGRLVDLASLLEKGPLVISFNRGPWCDYCGLELHALARAYPEIIAAGGEVVAIVPETAKYAKVLQRTRDLPFRVLTDLDLAYALSLGLVFWVGDKIKETYRQFGIDLEQFQGNGGWFLPIPATLVVGKDGRVRARFVDPDFRHRLGMENILRALAEAE
jgi:peroxiredoxin